MLAESTAPLRSTTPSAAPLRLASAWNGVPSPDIWKKAHAQICRDEEMLALSGKLEMEHYFYPFGTVPMRIVLP